MIDRCDRTKGFTVVELIVAMSISAVTLLSGYELLQALKETGDRQSADLAATAGTIRGLERIRDDLLHALPRTDSQEVMFSGASPDLENMGEATAVLTFSTLCPGDGDDQFCHLRRICEVSYELVKTDDTLGLYRRAVPVVGASRTSDTEEHELVLDGVDHVTFAFHGGQHSDPSFSSKEKLPVGVEITVTAYDQTWPLSIALPCGGSEKGS